MKSYPLILTAGEVRAVLNGTKTQHRVMVKPQPPAGYDRARVCGPWGEWENDAPPLGKFSTRCQFGTPGDRLWVRETWAAPVVYNIASPAAIPDWAGAWWKEDAQRPLSESELRWRSPVSMPRWASRITLVVESVRVQRVQDVSEEDARAEGMPSVFERFPGLGHDQRLTSGELMAEQPHRAAYAVAWDERHGSACLWKSNPWVFGLTFKRVEVSR